MALDNSSVHHAATVKQAMPALAKAGVTFFYLPVYSPQLSPIEPVWRQVKYQDLPKRSYPTDTALQTAGETALSRRVHHLESKRNLPRHP